jgi:hypothetical protein
MNPFRRKPQAVPVGSAEWVRVRARHLADNPRCAGCGETATTVNHRNRNLADLRACNLESVCERHAMNQHCYLSDG